MHFILNVGGVAGLIPLTGVPLLFISSGGTSLLSIMCCLGLAESEIIATRRNEDENNNIINNNREEENDIKDLIWIHLKGTVPVLPRIW